MIHDKYLKKGLCIGPMGFPQREDSARILEAKLKEAERNGFSYKRNFVTRLPLSLDEGERADISVITTADIIDRDSEIVVASGADLSHFQNNPVVTFGHDYSKPPVGRAMWVKFEPTRATATTIKAKTEYAPEGVYELADTTWQLVKHGFLKGKSVGILVEDISPPTQKEIDVSQGLWAKAERVIRKWSLFEYAVATVPANANALVEAVAKGELAISDDLVKALGLALPKDEDTIITDLWQWDEPAPELPQPKHCRPWQEVEGELLKEIVSGNALLAKMKGEM